MREGKGEEGSAKNTKMEVLFSRNTLDNVYSRDYLAEDHHNFSLSNVFRSCDDLWLSNLLSKKHIRQCLLKRLLSRRSSQLLNTLDNVYSRDYLAKDHHNF